VVVVLAFAGVGTARNRYGEDGMYECKIANIRIGGLLKGGLIDEKESKNYSASSAPEVGG
jgi:hypothetical protein